jgi:endonuclease/exonuclease/phosphatase family metal-dependent hydrolase
MSESQRIRIMSWNLNCGIAAGEHASPEAAEKGISHIVTCIKRLNPDIVALQEVLLRKDGESQASAIGASAGFRHIAQMGLSPSHLFEGDELGLAILAKWQICDVRKVFLPNPGMELSLPNGALLRSHDKGIISTKIRLPLGDIWFACSHLPPFHRFNRDPVESEFSSLWAVVDERLIELTEHPMISCIDFNTAKISTLLPKCFTSEILQLVIHQPTRPTGEQHDHILCSGEWSDIATQVIKSRFDHHLCLADLSLKSPEAKVSFPKVIHQENSTLLLHLSDLHFGEGSAEDVDWKTYIAFAKRENRRTRFEQFIRALPRTPDYVVVSGDITIAGHESGFRLFQETIDELIKGNFLPSASKFIVVPGNHDVIRGTETQSERDRWDLFFKYVGNKFVRPWIGACDPPINEVMQQFDSFIADDSAIWGGGIIKRADEASTAWFLPFIWDRSRNILIYAFNSASISGSRVEISAKAKDAAQSLRSWDGPLKEKVQTILDTLDRELQVDPARIDPREITLFSEIMDRIRQRAPVDLEKSLKIAVLHHHVAPVIREEVTKFEFLLNAGKFKAELRNEGFQLILHGHKHWPDILIDSSTPGEDSRHIVSGGTIGGGQASGKRPGFFLLEHDNSRQATSAKYITLRETGPPRRSILEEREIVLNLAAKEKNDASTSAQQDIKPIGLPELIRSTERSLMSCLRHEAVKQGAGWMGWSHALDENRVSVIATAYGLRILAMTRVSSRFHPRISRSLKSLLDLKCTDGGWSASSQSRTQSHPEPTAFALLALHSWNYWKELQEGKLVLEKLVADDSIFWQHVYSVATVGRILAEIDTRSELVSKLSNTLHKGAYRNSKGQIRYWSRQMLDNTDANFGWTDTQGSVIHTAHAVLALSRMYKATGGRTGGSPLDLQEACEWLISQEWTNTSEDINRQVELGKYDKLAVRHFVSPWVVIALLEADYNPNHIKIRSAVKELVLSHKDGLWNWGPLERPIWATHDALYALISFAMTAASV